MALCKTSDKIENCTLFRGCRIGHAIFNSLFAIIFGFALRFFWTSPVLPTSKPQGQIGGHFKFLTSWDVYAQFIVCALSVLVAVTNCNRIREFRDWLHHGIAIPYGFTVASMFWGLYFIDRNLIFPIEMEAFIPPLMNHMIHTLVFIAPLFNELTFYMDRKGCTFQLTLAFGISYMSVLLYYAFVLNFWIYPVFEFLNTNQQFLFILGSLALISTQYAIGGIIHKLRWKSIFIEQSNRKNK